MRSAGFPRAMQTCLHYMQRTPLSWRNQTLRRSTFFMPCMGLVRKVLRDRVEDAQALHGQRGPLPPVCVALARCACCKKGGMILGANHYHVTYFHDNCYNGAVAFAGAAQGGTVVGCS